MVGTRRPEAGRGFTVPHLFYRIDVDDISGRQALPVD